MTEFNENPIFNLSDDDRENILSEYDGPKPPAGLRLFGVLAGMYLGEDKDGLPLLKVVYKAVGGTYDGYTDWDNVSLKPSAAFKWASLIDDVLTVTVEDLAKRMKLDKYAETGAGYRVESIGKWENDGSLEVYFTVGYKSYTDDNGVKSKRSYVSDVEAA